MTTDVAKYFIEYEYHTDDGIASRQYYRVQESTILEMSYDSINLNYINEKITDTLKNHRHLKITDVRKITTP